MDESSTMRMSASWLIDLTNVVYFLYRRPNDCDRGLKPKAEVAMLKAGREGAK